MEIVFATSFFILGLIIGSFLNALSFRYNSGKSMLGRSNCFSCGYTLAFYDLIPVFSFVILKARCRKCRSRISFQYPIIELLSGLIFTGIYLVVPKDTIDPILFILPLMAHFIFWSSFLFITIYDLKHKIVPSEAIYLMVTVGLFYGLWSTGSVQIIYAIFMFLPFFLLWFLSRGRLMGLGDGKIALALGLMLPLEVASSGIILSFWIGALFAIFLLFIQKISLNSGFKKITMKSEVPFAPFMLIGAFSAFVLGLDLLNLSFFI